MHATNAAAIPSGSDIAEEGRNRPPPNHANPITTNATTMEERNRIGAIAFELRSTHTAAARSQNMTPRARYAITDTAKASLDLNSRDRKLGKGKFIEMAGASSGNYIPAGNGLNPRHLSTNPAQLSTATV